VKIAIDDFGTEYSSFDYLKTYRVNHLKIAQSFISAATADPDSATTIRAIINFARELGIGIIAEGVETQEQRTLLISTGSTTQAQGFYFSEAVDNIRASELLRLGSIAPNALSDLVTLPHGTPRDPLPVLA
jgi:EAL domain-containing protein (putative c-di-GMP-specific phosphodiesterase class I)